MKVAWRGLLSGHPGAQRRFEGNPLRLHYGTDDLSRPILLLRLDQQPDPPELGKAVGVDVGERPEYGEWTLVLTLREPGLTETFIDLCVELAYRSALGSDESAALRLFHRALQEFKDLLTGGSGRPSAAKMRGLIGELWFALRVVAPKLGPDGAVLSWTGPLGAAHDFRYPDNTVHEVKTTPAEGRTVQVSSLEQLDPTESSSLTLAVVALDERQSGAPDAMTARSLMAEFRELLIAQPASIKELDRRLEALGVANLEPTHDHHLAVAGFRQYQVTAGFPRLLREHAMPGLENVTYRIRLSAISDFEVSENQPPATRPEAG